jgi:hypothetical protein
MVNVTYRPYVAVRLRPLKFRLRHRFRLSVRKRKTQSSTHGAIRQHHVALERVMGIEPT